MVDVICMVLLCLGVKRVSSTGNAKDLGLFSYSDLRVKLGDADTLKRKPGNA